MADSLFFEFLLNDEPLVSLLDAAKAMDGVEFLHGACNQRRKFSFATAEPDVRNCLDWAKTDSPQDARKSLSTDQLGSVRAWTGTCLCYALTSVLRDARRTRESLRPVLPYARLLFSALQALPKKYIFEKGTLYRAEKGVMTTWDAKMHAPDGIFSFFAPTSFSRDPAVLQNFKGDTDARTVYVIRGASGWILDALSSHPEEEVLLEPVCHFQVTKAEKFDQDHEKVKMGEVKEGLHWVEGHVRPGVSLLAMDAESRVKALEQESFRDWRAAKQRNSTGIPELEFDPFSEAEWLAMNGRLPRKERDRRMSVLGSGAIFTTYRKRAKDGPESSLSSSFDTRQYAVKTVDKDDMGRKNITEQHVRDEARKLGLMKHKHIITYYGLEESDEEIGIIMESANGGSLARLIEHERESAEAGKELGVQADKRLEMMIQIASAAAYFHALGIVHRDIKPENILLMQPIDCDPLCVKVADFGVATEVSTVAGSALLSKAGTSPYFAPERGLDKAYGTMADMWAIGCVFVELVTLTRLNKGIWHAEGEHMERRKRLLQQIREKDEALTTVLEGLLQMDKSARTNGQKLKAELVAVREQREGEQKALGLARERLRQLQEEETGAGASEAAERGRTPLLEACRFGILEIVQALIKEGANASAADERGRTPLLEACRAGSIEIYRILIKAGADTAAKDHQGRTLLLEACAAGSVELCQALINTGADAGVVDNQGRTPLLEACRAGSLDAAQALITAGVDASSMRADGATPLSNSILSGSTRLMEFVTRSIAGDPGGYPTDADHDRYMQNLAEVYLDWRNLEAWLRGGTSPRALMGHISALLMCPKTSSQSVEPATKEQLRHVRAFLNHNEALLEKSPSKWPVTHTVLQLASQETGEVFADPHSALGDETSPAKRPPRLIHWLNKPNSHRCRLTMRARGEVRSVSYSKCGRKLARAEGNKVVVCDAETGFVESTLAGHRYVPSPCIECLLL